MSISENDVSVRRPPAADGPAPDVAPASSGPPPPSPDHAEAPRLHGPEAERDPVALFARLRALGPVAPVLLEGDVPAWFVSGPRELRQVMGRPEWFSRDCRRWNHRDRIGADHPLRPHVTWTPALAFAEGAEHRARVDAIGDALAAVDLIDLRDLSHRVAGHLVDRFAGRGRADLVVDYARQVPARVLARLYGIAEDSAPIADLVAATGAGPARRRLHGHLVELLRDRRRLPRADVPSRLASHRRAASTEEVALDLLLISTAWQTSTADWIADTLRLILVDAAFAADLGAGRITVSRALDEVLWRDTPARNILGRWAVQDCELGGRRIRRGDLLVVGLAAAGMDRPAGERPRLFFGHGEQGCPHPAPRMAATIAGTAVEVLLDRLPDMWSTPPPHGSDRRPSPWAGGPLHLPVTFDPRRT
ncbi:cytochrome P450 family protein [Nocardiopsis lambiniae]|uniref:Cytochrome P450 n=1 Tax=Nocardiopsis lambiniae TaxID=3075539 RepID=A0ABU2M9K2_9ACTN|nr:cytochrome P450 [Nocardiopsis sp. DSM 44743]MDT0328641.1 cytochrome P450 [Nocardiopsis sp. DSM 44743]